MIQDIAKFLTNPLLYFWIVLLIFLYKSRGNRRRLIILNIMFYCLCIGFTGSTLMSLWKVDDRYDKNIKYDAAIMLTGVIKPGDSISIGDTDYDFRFTSVSKRLIAGIGFVKTGHAKSLLFGNCLTKNYDEGPIIRKFAEHQGLKEDEIKIYGDIRRTVDEVNGVKEFLEENKITETILYVKDLVP